MAASNAKGLMEPFTVQLTALLRVDLPPPKVCRTFCCSGVCHKDQVLLLLPPRFLGEALFGNYVLYFNSCPKLLV